MKKGQKKRKFEDILSSINKDKFIELYNNPDIKSRYIIEYFSISDCVYRKILKLWNLPTTRGKKQTVKEVLEKYTVEEIEMYYKTHSASDVKEYFGITDGVFNQLRNRYFSYKTKEEIEIANTIGRNKVNYEEVIEKVKQTNLKKYGVTSVLSLTDVHKKGWETAEQKYGSRENFNAYRGQQISKKIKEKPRQSNFWWNEDGSTKQSIIDEYGSLEEFHKQRLEHTWKTKEEIYGDKYYTNCDKARKTCLEKYGLTYYPNTTINGHGKDSFPNKKFKQLLEDNNIKYEEEFYIQPYFYDFKVGNILIEINPAATHNINWSPFGDNTSKITKTYHQDKTLLAVNNGYTCIHVWDWDNINLIISLIKTRDKIYARKCIVKEINVDTANYFISLYHLQGVCKGQSVCLGLYYDDELVSVMTFGKPRYNNKYEYELLRYCSNKDVIGGSVKLFKYFLTNYNVSNIISYCDKSKFSGNVYTKLGFTLLKDNKPSRHWYNIKTHQHITDNLLKQRGYDQLFGTNYGKGTSNEELMLNNGFVEIYDSGQSSYEYVC